MHLTARALEAAIPEMAAALVGSGSGAGSAAKCVRLVLLEAHGEQLGHLAIVSGRECQLTTQALGATQQALCVMQPAWLDGAKWVATTARAGGRGRSSGGRGAT